MKLKLDQVYEERAAYEGHYVTSLNENIGVAFEHPIPKNREDAREIGLRINSRDLDEFESPEEMIIGLKALVEIRDKLKQKGYVGEYESDGSYTFYQYIIPFVGFKGLEGVIRKIESIDEAK